MRIKSKFIIFCIISAVLFFPMAPIFSDEISPAEKSELEQQLQEIESQIAEYQNELNSIKGEKNTLQNKIKQLKNQQASINLQIRSTNLQIKDLDNRLNQTKSDIDENIAKAVDIQSQIASLLRTLKRYDDYPLFYAIISSENWSEMFNEIQGYLRITANLSGLFEESKKIKTRLAERAEMLADAQDEARNLLAIKNLQQQQLAASVSEQNKLLDQTKGRENDYQTALKANQKKSAEIKNRLYQLLEVSQQITFGEAAAIAKWASELSGVRAAFLLAILTQESNLGKNVGACNREGDPPSKSWRVVMKPSRDHEPFLNITAELGRNPDITPVSCPMRDSRGNWIGWGGAMGPAQFIPSTWMGYKDKVAAITGKTANPWDIRDAFIASALKLKAGGAGAQSGEWAAAMRYFSGSTNLRYRFYGDNVIALAAQYQEDIDALGN